MSYIGTKPANAALTASDIADDIISLAKMSSGTDGNLITYDASGNPAAVATGTSGHFLKSQGAGSVPVFAAAGGGLCLQVVGMTKTDTTSYGTASWSDISGMSLAITPTKASSKILLNINCSFGGRALGQAAKVQVDIDGGGYNDLLVGDAASSRTRCTWGLRQPGGGTANGDYNTASKGISYLYTPSYSLTDVITFKLQWNATSGNTIYLNRVYDNTDDANYVRTVSMMTAMEID